MWTKIESERRFHFGERTMGPKMQKVFSRHKPFFRECNQLENEPFLLYQMRSKSHNIILQCLQNNVLYYFLPRNRVLFLGTVTEQIKFLMRNSQQHLTTKALMQTRELFSWKKNPRYLWINTWLLSLIPPGELTVKYAINTQSKHGTTTKNLGLLWRTLFLRNYCHHQTLMTAK